MSPLKLWRLSIALQRRGHGRLARAAQRLNTLLYSNSLSPRAAAGAGLWLGHHAFGLVVQPGVEIGEGVRIWHNVSIEADGEATRVLIEDEVNIGASAVIAAAPGQTLRIGRGARIGAGAVITEDVAAGATAMAAKTRVIDGEDG